MIIDHGSLLFDGALRELRERFWRESAVKFEVRDREQTQNLDRLRLPGVTREKVDEFSYRLRFARDEWSTADVIRRVVNAVEVRDVVIEEQPIEEVVRRIYLGEILQESKR